MAPPVKLKPPRTYPTIQGVQCLRCHIQQASPNGRLGQVALVNGVAYHFGTLPAGCFVLPAAKHVLAVFDGTTPTIDVGTLTTPNAFMPSASIAPGAIAFAGLVQGTGMGYIAVDTPVYVKFALVSGSNTVGECDLVLPFYVNLD